MSDVASFGKDNPVLTVFGKRVKLAVEISTVPS